MSSRRRVTIGLFILLTVSIVIARLSISWEKNTPEVSQSSQNQPEETGFETIYVGKTKVLVERADSPEKVVRGLSGRESLLPNHGMLFFLEEPSRAGFWMKEMKFSIDIIWMSAEKKIIHIEQSLSPETYPQVFSPDQDALYVLEVPAGFSNDHILGIGDSVQF